MATMGTRSTLQGIGLVLLLTIINAASVHSAGVLSNIYKKASQENRPLILVLDNNDLNDKSKDHSSKNWLTSKLGHHRDNERDLEQRVLPILLQQLSQVYSHDNDHQSKPKNTQSITKTRSRLRDRRQRLRSQSNDDRDDGDRLDRDNSEPSIKSFIKNNVKDQRDASERTRDAEDDRALRTSVIKNLLRYSNDLNCRAKDKCANKCGNKYNGSKKNQCKNQCEMKYECEEENDDPCDDGDCDVSDDCGNSNECGVSTKGEKWDEVTDTCKRC